MAEQKAPLLKELMNSGRVSRSWLGDPPDPPELRKPIEFKKMEQTDVSRLSEALPEPVYEALLYKEELAVLAGGAIRDIYLGETPKDYDLFVQDSDTATRLAKWFESEFAVTRRNTTQNARTLVIGREPNDTKIQIITRWTFDSPKQVAEGFDFVMCAASIWNTDLTWRSWVHRGFFADVQNRRLTYRRPVRTEDVAGSFLRVMRFVERGWKITDRELAKALARMVSATAPAVSAHVERTSRQNPEETVDEESVWTDKILRAFDTVKKCGGSA